MEKLPMCRICLVQNVRMYLVVNSNFHELYEKLTDIPFVTEDKRPILACFFCFAKLKQCCRFLRKCLKAEELFAQMMNEDYEPNPLINQDHLDYFGGLIKSPIQNISIVDVVKTESIAIKEELPAVCERLDVIIEPKKEHQSDELELENFDNICEDVADIPPHNSESDLKYYVPILEFKTEVKEEQEVSKKQEVWEMNKLELENFDNICEDVADIPPHNSESDLKYYVPILEFKTEVKEEQEVSKKQEVWEMNRANVVKEPKLDTRKTILEAAITAEQMKKEKSDLKVSHTTHPGEKFKCDICQRSFSENTLLAQHIRIHNGEKPFKCDVCQRSFSEKNHLTQHMRIHTGEKPYKCDVCQRSFSQQGHLTLHSRIHTGEKPYKCDVCQRSFSEKGCLTKHTRIHTGEKPYKCDVCQRSFSEKGCLTRHTRIHTGEKPYKCDVCQRSFSQKAVLTKHIRVHTGEKPYKCDVCQCSFSRKSNCTKHIRIHTGEKSYN